MLWVPTVRLLVAQLAVRLLPEPLSATALQPLIELPPSRKFTLPVGALPLTVAVRVTPAPEVDGLSELATVVPLPGVLTTCETVVLLEAALLLSPL